MSKNPVFLTADNISKQFYGIYALKNVNVCFRRGEIVGLIGENGAGKSTLMKIISGVYSKDSGTISIEDQTIHHITPNVAKEYGISMVFQDSRLVPDLNVGQNIWLANEKLNALGAINSAEQDIISESLLGKFDIDINIRQQVKDLSVAQRQLVEIVKAISKETNMLILDEPTSSLTPREVSQLFNIVRGIAEEGTAVVFISHRIQELMQICQRFIVLKDGECVGEISAKESTEKYLVNMMIGREIDKVIVKDALNYSVAEKVLEVSNISLSPHYENVSFDVYKGEILGFYGIEGNGQREILRSLMGLLPGYSGSITLEGADYHAKSTREAIDRGISFITNDRHGENIFMNLPLIKNIINPNLAEWTNFGILDSPKAVDKSQEVLTVFSVKYDNLNQLARELSGGNQQKVAIAGRFIQEPKVYIFDEPTIGVDVGSKSEIYGILKNLAESGVGIIVLSSDLPEIIGISDRIIPVSKGKVQEALLKADATEEAIMGRAILGSTLSVENQVDPNLDPEITEQANRSDEAKIRSDRKLVRKIKHFFSGKWGSIIILVVITALLGLIGGFYNERFLASYNVGLILWQVVPLALIAMSQTFVTIAGVIDLSVGPLMSLITCVLSYTLVKDEHILLGVLIAVLTGVACGLFNALIVVKLKVQHFIGTLSSQIVFWGIALILRHTASGSISPAFSRAIKYKIGSDWPVIFGGVLLVVILFEYILQRRRFGTYLYAVGSATDAAFSSGIRVSRIRTIAYVLSGLFASLAGMVLAVRIGSGDPQSGTTFTMQSLTAVVLGGVSLSGGKGSFLGPFFGAILLATSQNFLNMMRVSAYWQYVITGALLLISASIYYYGQKRRKK